MLYLSHGVSMFRVHARLEKLKLTQHCHFES